MTDREKAGLRGPVNICIEENIYPIGTVSIKSEYAIAGKLLLSRTSHQDGSEWVITDTYDADGRLAKVVGGKLEEPGLESLYAYDAAGRPLSITNHLREGARTDFRYDPEGRKTAIQTFERETLLGLQDTGFVGSAWDAIQMGFGVPVGGKVTTSYDQNDQPAQAEIHDANGQLVSRIVRTYNANGQVTEQKPSWINPASVFLDKMPTEQRAQLNPDEVNRFSLAMVTKMGGQAQAGAWYTYDSRNRLTSTREGNMVFEKDHNNQLQR